MATLASAGRQPRLKMTRAQWAFLLLLVLSICINYVDRGSLSVAGKMLAKDLSLNNIQLGF